jgi:hypothetical protein
MNQIINSERRESQYLLNKNPYSPIPTTKLNHGWYNGKPARGPWGGRKAIPEAAILNHANLRSVPGIPVNAFYQMQAGNRPGNNSGVQIPGVERFVGDHKFGPFNLYCIPETCLVDTRSIKGYDCRKDGMTNFLQKSDEKARYQKKYIEIV